MRSIFHAGFNAEPWTPALGRPRLGQWGAIISAAITAAGGAYQAYESREAAEEMKEAAEARAEAERARAEAEKARAEAEAKKAAEQAQAAPAVPSGEILGIPQDYVIYGGLGLGAVALIGLVISLAT